MIRPASEEFELVQRASGAGLVSTKAMSMGVTIAALLFLLGVCVGCVCSLRLVAVVLNVRPLRPRAPTKARRKEPD